MLTIYSRTLYTYLKQLVYLLKKQTIKKVAHQIQCELLTLLTLAPLVRSESWQRCKFTEFQLWIHTHTSDIPTQDHTNACVSRTLSIPYFQITSTNEVVSVVVMVRLGKMYEYQMKQR